MTSENTKTVPIDLADQWGWTTLSVEQSRQIDQTAIDEFGVAGITLMENAGTACANRLLEMTSDSDAAMILCGSGNNGGDGFVIARHFHQTGKPVRVLLLASPQKLRGDARLSYDRAVETGVAIESILDASQIAEIIRSSDGLIVDCLLGTGANGDPREPYASAIRSSNQCAATRIAIDIPSGLQGDTGVAGDPTFRADLTLTFVTAKTGMRNPDAMAYLGAIEIVDIGLPEPITAPLRSFNTKKD
ncbi:NAD(P)H-hydrate epimerase [Neorhodopirellula pilleata]|uniref:NAD(P)H-hydrate epimerase n=1 Tax=Neorhodopirellula pilleata TaxID=2714738 RepID=A0A5C6AAP0_9BACT|nr:NAD(P)H-hydrate epimerase [Neorhodopirellula pilleata]TWT96470.1 Bifunctional NAD(P)H-hydrate repair enzyme Nnr [Neorhodopirellula pilleata]